MAAAAVVAQTPTIVTDVEVSYLSIAYREPAGLILSRLDYYASMVEHCIFKPFKIESKRSTLYN